MFQQGNVVNISTLVHEYMSALFFLFVNFVLRSCILVTHFILFYS